MLRFIKRTLMTLQELFDLLGRNPAYVIFFFVMLPFTALLSGWIAKGEGHLSPWKYLYATLIYLACVPGIFAVTLSIYFFLFERRSILDTNVYTQLLPVISMVLTLFIVRKNVNMDNVPGFDKLSGLIMMISATLAVMWFVDRTRIYVISFLPFHVALLIFAGLLLIIRFGWSKFFGKPQRA